MKKVISLLLVIIMILTMVPVSVFAADEIEVKLVSFMRGDVTYLRSSELLEVQVEGYDGNISDLSYKWTSSLGTYLYIYNSHNMYGINNSDGEIEIYNSDKTVKKDREYVPMFGSKNMEGRTYDKTYTGVGFAWAAVYGADLTNNSLNGTVTVEVFDKNGNSLGSDSYKNFTTHNLQSDLDNVVIGIFEGDRINVLDLLGQSGVVHITCSASSVSSANIKSGDVHIDLETEKIDRNTFNYFVKGIKAGTNDTNGDAQLNILIAKQYCKFHANTTGTAMPVVYVFKKPKTSTTTTTLTLVSNIDNRCEYFIGSQKGEKQPDGTILFTGLTPNTDYTVVVRAAYDDNGETKYAYGYVEDTTKPAYKATVKTYLDNTIMDVEGIHGDGVELLLSKDGNNFVGLTKTATGAYEAVVDNGTYFPYHHYENDIYKKISKYELIIQNSNAEIHLHHYSVKYDTNGGAFKSDEEVGTEVYSSSSAVNATSNVPVRDGFIFTGWDYNGKVIGSGKQVTASITSPVTLKAKWEKAVNVTINVIIDHKTVDGFDPNTTRADLDVDFLEMTANSPAFVETGDKLLFRKDTVKDENGNAKPYTYTLEDNVSTYTATDYTYTGLLESSTFGVALSKSGYDVGAIEKNQDEFGNWVINIPLTYNPDDFDIDFSLEMADDVPKELYPDAVIVKVAYWNTETIEWKIISQQETVGAVVRPGVRVDIDKTTGEGSGSYPVWRFDGSKNPYGYRAVVTGFVYGDSTIVVPDEEINGNIAKYFDDTYTATMNDVSDGKLFGASLNGAYYNKDKDVQVGTLHGVITVENYDVTFDANGGEINGGNTYVEEDEYFVPDTNNYVPTFDEHTFKGWYKDPEFKEPAVKGEVLTDNITLYAKWDQILTGNVRVAGSYIQDGEIVDVWAIDRAESAVIVLQEIVGNEAYNIDRQTVKIVWPMAEMVYGLSEEYKFTGLDPTKEYRTEVLILNYGTTYQNSTTVVVEDDNYAADYNATDYTAVYPEASKWKTFVNAYLSFEPASYFQPVEVDSTAIGKDYRPENTLVQVWYKATGTDNAYQVISQHTVWPYGIQIGMGTDGKDNGDYGYTVWNSVYDGALYDYQAHLEKIENKDVSTWPVSVVYGAPSRYSPLNDAPTGVLQVKIIPNAYNIIYNENYAVEGVNVVSYGSHTWSYETTLGYEPTREGYVFDGWYSNPECTGEVVTKIAADVVADTELYAKWVPGVYDYTVNYLEEGTGKALADVKSGTGKYNANVTEDAIAIKGYTLADVSSKTITIDTANNVINFYYTVDSYTYTVNYLEEGTNKVLATSKSAAATYGDVVNENAIAIDGYIVSGDSTKSITIDTANNEITFYYAKRGDFELTVNYVDKANNEVLSTETKASQIFGDVITAESLKKAISGYKFDSASADSVIIGTGTNEITLYYVRNDYSYTVNYLEEGTGKVLSASKSATAEFGATVTDDAITIDSYMTVGATKQTITISDGTNVINFYYTSDTIGGGNNGDNSDGIPDKYQKKVIFRVVNGTWSDGTTENIVKVLNLMKGDSFSGDGTATLTAPKGMKPNAGYGDGEWTITPPTTVKGTNTVTYTYTFIEKPYGYEIEGSDTVTMYEEETVHTEIKLVPDKGTDPNTLPTVVKYESADESIATVDQNGKITGVKAGRTTVTVTLSDGNTYIIHVVVKEREGITVVFGKTEGIGWYRVSEDGGATYKTVFGNSTIEVKKGTQLIIKAGDLMGDAFTFYVNGNAVTPDENNSITVTVDNYMLIGALGLTIVVPDPEESLNWFQKIIKAIKDFFARLFGKK